MRLGIIDLGTNSVRFDVHQIGPGRKIRRLHREKIMVRLGQGIFTRGRLDRGAIRRTLHAFARFARLARDSRVQRMVAFGTSALREAQDRDRLLTQIQSRTGIRVRVISGEEEAKLIAVGILAHENLPKKTFALIDIGGGSTEISICRGDKILHSMSFRVGTARVQQVFLKTSPPRATSLAKARSSVRNSLFQTLIPERWPKVETALVSSGTARALHKILEHHSDAKAQPKNKVFRRTALHTLVRGLERMTTSELLGVAGMEPKRVDMILAGSLILDECLDVLGAEKAKLTSFALRDGILAEELLALRRGAPTQMALHQADLLAKAAGLGLDPQHLKRTVRLTEDLFDRLRSLHKLSPAWKTYLVAAALLRKTGEAISVTRCAEHSSYIVRNADLPGMEAWETALVADLCLHHDSTKTGKNVAPAFLKLLALLRVVDALDSGPESEVRLRGVRIGPDRVDIRYGGSRLTGLESTQLELRGRLFRKVFKRSVRAALNR